MSFGVIVPLRLGAFALFALCGQWGGPKKVTYASEPAPEEIIAASKNFARLLDMFFWIPGAKRKTSKHYEDKKHDSWLP